MYGASKLALELVIREYLEMFGMRGVITRWGALSGPWQFGKIDQGFVVLWVTRHIYGGLLSYIGYGGKGKQVRDVLHVSDLYDLLRIQITGLSELSGETFNVGGGPDNTASLIELSTLRGEATGSRLEIECCSGEPPGRHSMVCE